MLSRVDMFNVSLEAKMMRMSLVRRVMMMGMAPLTTSYIIFPGPRSRSGELRSRLPAVTKYGKASILNVSLDLLNGIHYWKMKDKERKYPSKVVFKSKVKDYLKTSFSNGNL